eukprot:5997179-Amphidinium_carterae.1
METYIFGRSLVPLMDDLRLRADGTSTGAFLDLDLKQCLELISALLQDSRPREIDILNTERPT